MNAFRHPAHYRGGATTGAKRTSPDLDNAQMDRERQRAERGSMLLLEALCDAHGEQSRPDLYVHPSK
jgi:hypothetical protein